MGRLIAGRIAPRAALPQSPQITKVTKLQKLPQNSEVPALPQVAALPQIAQFERKQSVMRRLIAWADG